MIQSSHGYQAVAVGTPMAVEISKPTVAFHHSGVYDMCSRRNPAGIENQLWLFLKIHGQDPRWSLVMKNHMFFKFFISKNRTAKNVGCSVVSHGKPVLHSQDATRDWPRSIPLKRVYGLRSFVIFRKFSWRKHENPRAPYLSPLRYFQSDSYTSIATEYL